jgi:hypothetical protein
LLLCFSFLLFRYTRLPSSRYIEKDRQSAR